MVVLYGVVLVHHRIDTARIFNRTLRIAIRKRHQSRRTLPPVPQSYVYRLFHLFPGMRRAGAVAAVIGVHFGLSNFRALDYTG